MFYHHMSISLKVIRVSVFYPLKQIYSIKNFFFTDFRFTELLSIVHTSVYSTYIR